MKKTKYIELSTFLKQCKSIIEEVYTEHVEYIVMIDHEPKIRIIAIEDENGKKVITTEAADKKSLEKFIE